MGECDGGEGAIVQLNKNKCEVEVEPPSELLSEIINDESALRKIVWDGK